MTCSICEYEFCWVCKRYAGDEVKHYDPSNPLSCGIGKMDKMSRSWYYRYGHRLLIVIAVLLFWPIIIVFFCPVKWAIKAYRQQKNNEVFP